MICFQGIKSKLALASLLVTAISTSSTAQDCEFSDWTIYKGDALRRHVSADAYFFVTDHMRIDADGAPNAYGPNDIGLDYNANAGYGLPRKSWWKDVLVPDPRNSNNAYIQETGDFVGMFVSKTALADRGLAPTDPQRYVDATTFPYIVFPGPFLKMSGTGRLGDFGYAINLTSGLTSPFIVADIGPSAANLGEVSMKLAENLGGVDVSPRDGSGQPGGDILYIVFRYSSSDDASDRWRKSMDEIADRANAELEKIGGSPALMACIK